MTYVNPEDSSFANNQNPQQMNSPYAQQPIAQQNFHDQSMGNADFYPENGNKNTYPETQATPDTILYEQARNAGIPILDNPNHELDPSAVRAI